MSTLIESAFEKANFTKSDTLDVGHGPRSLRHLDADIRKILAIVRIDPVVRINTRCKCCHTALKEKT